MVSRTITSTSTHISSQPGGYALTVTTNFVESTMGGGSMRTHTEVYDRLSRDELSAVMEHVAGAPIAGEQFVGSGLQLSLI